VLPRVYRLSFYIGNVRVSGLCPLPNVAKVGAKTPLRRISTLGHGTLKAPTRRSTKGTKPQHPLITNFRALVIGAGRFGVGNLPNAENSQGYPSELMEQPGRA
jgi:hypothetical protein